MRLAFLIAILSCLCFTSLCLTGTDASAVQIVGIGGKCLNVKGGVPNDGTPIILWRHRERAMVAAGQPDRRPRRQVPERGGVAAMPTAL